jgi:hypothetical protein
MRGSLAMPVASQALPMNPAMEPRHFCAYWHLAQASARSVTYRMGRRLPLARCIFSLSRATSAAFSGLK